MTSLLPDDDETPPLAARLAPRLRLLAQEGLYFGTSSWKYEGWLGSIYQESRYRTRGKLSKKKFDEGCLAEYAETFPTVCGEHSAREDEPRGVHEGPIIVCAGGDRRSSARRSR